MQNIKVKSLGPINEADINFGDLTFFVGPQASGKSILLQLSKLIADKDSIEMDLENYGYVWGTNLEDNMKDFLATGPLASGQKIRLSTLTDTHIQSSRFSHEKLE